MEPAQLSVNSKDAEILATRLFTVEEICRIFGVPPFMVGHTDKTTSWGAGVENMGIGFVRYTLQRHLTPIAQELNSKLWPVRQRYFVEHITAALERGDLKARYDAYRTALGRAGERPFISVDEIRRRENMPPNADLMINEAATAPQAICPPPRKRNEPETLATAAGKPPPRWQGTRASKPPQKRVVLLPSTYTTRSWATACWPSISATSARKKWCRRLMA
jgi:hypothetical protein